MTTCHPKSTTTLTTGSRPISIKLLKPEEIADLLNVKVSTVYQWARESYLPSVSLGLGKKKVVRFNRDDVETWVLERSKSRRTSWIPEKEKLYE